MRFTDEQNAAINSIGQNTIVSASAGSGKTTIMMEKVARLISGELGPKVETNSMLIVTFTKASARDLKNKTAKKIKALINKTDDEELQESLKRQLEELPLASISTLHSFCSIIIREYFSKLNLDPTFSVMEEDESNIILKKAISNVIEKHAKDDKSKEYKDLNRLMGYSFEKNIISTYEFLRVSNVSKKPNETYKDNENNIRAYECSEEIKKKFYADIKRKFIELLQKGQELKSNLSIEEKGRNCLNDLLSTNEDFIGKCELDKPVFDKIPNLPKGMCEEIKNYKQSMADILKKIKKTDSGISFNQYDRNIIDAYLNIIDEVDEEYSTLKSKDNKLDFSDLEHYMLTLLDDEECKKTLRERYRFIFVDEYQDINKVQETIINKLSNNNNVFMVGDVKQSIYGFRHTDPTIFIGKVDSYTKDPTQGNALSLKSNYRSRKKILDFCNDIFNECMEKETTGVDYRNDAQLEFGQQFYDCAEVDPIVSIKICNTTPQDSIEDKEEEKEAKDVYSVKLDVENINIIKGEAEGKYIAEKIKYLVNNKKIVKEGFEKKVEAMAKSAAQMEQKEYNADYLKDYIEHNSKNRCSEYLRNIEYKDITLLCRAKDSAQPIIQAIIKNGIPVDVSGVAVDDDNEIISSLMSLLKIIDNYYDDVNLVSVLLSNFGGFTQEELVNIRDNFDKSNKDGNFYLAFDNYKKEDEIKTKIDAFKEKINGYKFKARYCKVDEILEEITQDDLFVENIMSNPNGSKLLFQVKTFINQIKSKAYNVSLSRFLSIARTNPNIEKIEASNLSSDNCVNTSTIHASKGLQYPVVFLINANKRFADGNKGKNSTEPLKATTNKEYGVMLPHISEEEDCYEDSNQKNMLKYLNNKESITEEMRLLYVALTRAKEYLFVTASNVDEKKSDLSFSDIKSFFDILLYTNQKNPKFFDTYLDKDPIENELDETEQDIEMFKDEIDEDLLHKIKAQLNDTYPHIDSTTMSLVKTVTEANKAARDEDEVVNYLPSKKDKENIYRHTTSEGTAYHHVMELIDFNNYTLEDVKESIETMLAKGQITEDEAKIVSPKIIYECLDSELMKIARHSECYKEKKFKMYLPSNDVFGDGIEDKILLQGTIDLIIKDPNADSVILVDYKYSNESIDKIKETYQVQINLYQKAIETCMGVKVDKKLIYVLGKNEIIQY